MRRIHAEDPRNKLSYHHFVENPNEKSKNKVKMKSSSSEKRALEVNPNFEVPLGFRYVFDPRDHELIVYLSHKANGEPLPHDGVIKEIDLYSVEDLSTLFDDGGKGEGNIRYVFTRVKKLSATGLRIDRKVNNGYRTWKGIDRGKIIFNREGDSIGCKKNFTFVDERKGKTGFNMTEFSLNSISLRSAKFKDYVLCRIKRKPVKQRISPEEENTCCSTSSENVPIGFPTPVTTVDNFFSSSRSSFDSEKFLEMKQEPVEEDTNGKVEDTEMIDKDWLTLSTRSDQFGNLT